MSVDKQDLLSDDANDSDAANVVDETTDDSVQPVLGNKIKQARIGRGFTQVALAQAINMARSTLSNIEIGRHHPTLPKLRSLSQVLNVTVGSLLGMEPMPEFPKSPKATIHVVWRVQCSCGYEEELEDRTTAEIARKAHPCFLY
jgi:transcriptional regulator with XRE-family HTH domain